MKPQELEIRESTASTIFRVHVIPRAAKSEIAGYRAGALLVRLAAAPIDDAANDALIRLLAARFDIARSQLTIITGERSRDKQIRVKGLTGAEVLARLACARR